MNYTQTFEQFASGLKGTDLALYAGAGIILFILFKDKLSPVQKLLIDLKNKYINSNNSSDGNKVVSIAKPVVTNKEDLFFDLVASWKQTRDLAVKSGCSEAVKVVDQMFPFLSPTVCVEEQTINKDVVS